MDVSDWRSLVYEHGPYAILAAVFVFMLWIRTRASDSVITEGAVLFSGNDPWYHSRIVHLTVGHFPATPNFDPWSYFPYGTGRHSGFGGLFDQLIALAALVVGLGDPSPRLIDVVTAYAPAVFGAATVVPAYLIAKRLTDRWSGLIAAVLLSLASGQFLSRTVVGTADHQSAEALFGAIAVLGFIYAIETAYEEKPTVADLRDRNWSILRRPAIAAVAGGVAIASYLMLWPPGVMIPFSLGVVVVLQSVRDHFESTPVEYLAFGTAGSMLTAGILTLLYAKSYTLEATAFSLLQPLVAIGIAAGVVVLFYVSEYLSRENYPPRYYPVAVAALIAASLAVTAIVFPRGIDLLTRLVTRIYSFGLLASPSALTVAEIRPATLDDAWRAFGAVFVIAVVGLLIMIARVVTRDRPTELIVIVWSVTIFSSYFTMIRFGYYVAVNVAVLAAFAVYWVGKFVSLDDIRDVEDVEAYQLFVVLIVVVLVVPGNVVAVSGHQPVWETADRFGGTNSAWHEELTWMRNNTPEEPLDYTRRYAPPDDGDFDYPEGAYGVMSWWDYGHWITVQGHRIPDANPFQQGPRPASAYLLAQSEERANLLLEALPSLQGRSGEIGNLSNDDLRSMIEGQSPQRAGEDTRYVMIDDQMAAGKFAAIATWTGPGYSSFVSNQQFRVGNEQARVVGLNDRYESTMLARLYYNDASGLEHYRLVHETESQTTFVSVARQRPGGWEATGLINRRLSQGLLNLVQSRQDLQFYDVRRASTVKTFERVEGARLTGRADVANRTSVVAFLQLRTNAGRNVTYIQQTETAADGSFSMTVPYPTSDAVAPADGGTDSGVTARGTYTVQVGSPLQPRATGQASVPEPAVYEGRTIEVDLEPVQTGNGTSNGTAGNASGNGSARLGGPPTGAGSGPEGGTRSVEPPAPPLDRPRARYAS